jgi:hypothetical protein
MINPIINLLASSVIAILIFTIFVIFVFRTGLVWKSRNKDGLLKKKHSLASVLSMLILPAGFIVLQVIFSRLTFEATDHISIVLSMNFMLFAILFIYDSLVIDYLVLSLWRPDWLKIPSTLNKDSMKKHILISIPIGTIIGAVMTLISTSIFYLI